MMEYLVQSLKSRKKFQDKNHILNMQEIKLREIEKHVQALLDAFMPSLMSRGLKIGIENLISVEQAGGNEKSSELGSEIGRQ